MGAQARSAFCLSSLAALSGAPAGPLGHTTFPEFGRRARCECDRPRDAPATPVRCEGDSGASEGPTGGALSGARGRLTPPSCEGIAATGGYPRAPAGRLSRFSRLSRATGKRWQSGGLRGGSGGAPRGARGGGGRGGDWPAAAGRGGRDWPARRGERRAAGGDWLRTRKQEGGRRRSRLAGSSRRRRRPRSLLRSLLRPLLRPSRPLRRPLRPPPARSATPRGQGRAAAVAPRPHPAAEEAAALTQQQRGARDSRRSRRWISPPRGLRQPPGESTRGLRGAGSSLRPRELRRAGSRCRRPGVWGAGGTRGHRELPAAAGKRREGTAGSVAGGPGRAAVTPRGPTGARPDRPRRTPRAPPPLPLGQHKGGGAGRGGPGELRGSGSRGAPRPGGCSPRHRRIGGDSQGKPSLSSAPPDLGAEPALPGRELAQDGLAGVGVLGLPTPERGDEPLP